MLRWGRTAGCALVDPKKFNRRCVVRLADGHEEPQELTSSMRTQRKLIEYKMLGTVLEGNEQV